MTEHLERHERTGPVAPELDERTRLKRERQSGFTLIELLAVVAIMAVMTMGVMMFTRSGSSGATLKASAVAVAARLTDARTKAMTGRRSELVLIDVHRRQLVREGSKKIMQIDPEIGLSLIASDAERLSSNIAGIRFFPNGSSSGATLRLDHKGAKYDVRVDWLTGRVAVQPAT